jgi:hypothetical protein
MEEKEKLSMCPRWWPDTRMDWPTVSCKITLTLLELVKNLQLKLEVFNWKSAEPMS